MKEYKRFLAMWEHIRDLNKSDIFMYGEAGYSKSNEPCVFFDNDNQKANYNNLDSTFNM